MTFSRELCVGKIEKLPGFARTGKPKFEAWRMIALNLSRECLVFINPHELESVGKHYRFDAAIIASGSVVRLPIVDGLNPTWDGIWTNEEILSNTSIPESLTVIGAGAVGLEFSLRYARLGSESTLISHSGVLPRYPAKFGERLAFIYEREGVRVLTSRKIVRIARDFAGFCEIGTEGADGYEPIMSEKVLFATGRRPAVDHLRLDAAGISLSEKGVLEIGEDMRVVGQNHIFAAGIVGKRMVVHHAHIEAGIAAKNAVSDGDGKWAKRSNIQVIFSDPEFAFAGMRPSDAEKAGHKLVTASAESRDVGKLHLAGDDFGFGEFCADAKSARLLGAGLLCDDASNLIHLPAYAIDHEHTIDQLADAEYYHPTKIEIVSEIGDALCGKLGGHPFARAEE